MKIRSGATTPPFPISRAEISRSRLLSNFAQLRSLVQQQANGQHCDLFGVVKGNAYGHGAHLCAPWLVEAGAQWLGVTSVEEGLAVRQYCPEINTLVMVGFHPANIRSLLDARLVPTIWDSRHIESLAEIANQRSLASDSIPVHLEIDTGMSRQGVNFPGGELTSILGQIRAVPALRLDGVFTHFASSEILDAEQNSQQMAQFEQATKQIFAAGFRPRWIHAGSSATVLGQRQLQSLLKLTKSVGAMPLLRPGLALYGYVLPLVRGDGEVAPTPIDLQPVMAWKTSIASIRFVKAGAEVGYNGTFIAPARMRLALLPVGYADGLNRKLSNRGHVLVGGTRAPIVGRVSMDLTIVDVSHTNAKAGEEVVILGEQNGQRITADDHARWAETIPYEILCVIGTRVARVEAP